MIKKSTTIPDQKNRIILMEELYRRYGHTDRSSSNFKRRLQFFQKKYGWIIIIGGAKVIKRMIDIIGSVVMLLTLFPIFLLVGLLIKITDKGFLFLKKKVIWT